MTGSLTRWANPDTWIALGSAVAVITVAGGLLSVYHNTRTDAASSATAECDKRWMAKQIADNAEVEARKTKTAEAAAAAAQKQRDIANADKDAAVDRASDLEVQLRAYEEKAKDGDPTVLPQDLVRSLRQ